MLQTADFARFFHGCHGHDPFPWQQALVEQLARDDCWPDVLDLPTGAGKTAALDAAVFHLALRADDPQRAALRIVLAVDRRLVVDDAYRRARRLVAALRDPAQIPEPARPVVEEVRHRLLQLAGAGEPPLVAVRLRGGAPLEHDWTRTPTQPTILCSTVDQVGSRLLFRGYGVSNRMRPVHAGLLGEGTLILLNEAHLSEPFRETLENVRAIGTAKVRTVVLTATPGGSYERPFGLGVADHAHSILRRRIAAAKPATLMKPIQSAPAAAFAGAAREMAERLRHGGVAAPAVGVVVNRVDLARAVFDELNESESNCLLMIGRSRDVDRGPIESMLDPLRTDAPGRAEAGPLMVVATQCLEVGVDLDLDGLVTQAAPLDALRQRFGRLNRAGRPIPAEAAILVTMASLAKKADDPVYGDRIRKTWEALTSIATDGRVDFGFKALNRRLRKAKIGETALASPPARAPVLMPAYLDLWSQTSPPPAADPEVGLFLHGVERAPAEVSLVWRSDITASDMTAEGGAHLREILERLPPRAAEMVEVPIWAAAAWLMRSGTARAARLADAPEREAVTDFEPPAATARMAFRWAGADDPRTGPVGHGQLGPGDVLVVPSYYGGCDRHGWAPQNRNPVADVADEAACPYRGRRAPEQGKPVTEDDVLACTARRPIALDEHTDGVVQLVERFTATLGLPAPIAEDLRLAALLHDAGKIDERFQLFLVGGDWWNRPEGSALAKSGRPHSRAAWISAGLPKGWRHEALSVRLAATHRCFAAAHDPLLVLWLIGTHHGLGRPFFGFTDPEGGNQGPQSLAYDFNGLDWASLFGSLRLRYGTWGLAHLETILRLADHRAPEADA